MVEILSDGRLHRAQDLAGMLEVSERTIYRDMITLAASGVPVDGERGLGYLLREPVFLSPMALSSQELEALTLGMAIVAKAADEELRNAAASLSRKIEGHSALRRRAPAQWGFDVHALDTAQKGLSLLPTIRRSIREERKLSLTYTSLAGESSQRVVRPLQTEYWGSVWTLSAWCEQRGDFRVFRVDQIERCEITDTTFESEPGKTLEDYLALISAQLTGNEEHG
ncbi:YafY family protein [Parasphingorhabdus litoris]|uniref:helix-turn-helix transcriptional regulator n=1 Tax=Parasphingorhabdus litoris TaxID=394733 RepID=UPI0031DF5897